MTRAFCHLTTLSALQGFPFKLLTAIARIELNGKIFQEKTVSMEVSIKSEAFRHLIRMRNAFLIVFSSYEKRLFISYEEVMQKLLKWYENLEVLLVQIFDWWKLVRSQVVRVVGDCEKRWIKNFPAKGAEDLEFIYFRFFMLFLQCVCGFFWALAFNLNI